MQAPSEILTIYKSFDQHPMENLTKAWCYSRAEGKKQRTVEQMREHRKLYSLSGNCFDLALWLIDEFRSNDLLAYGVGHGLHTAEAHVAVVVHDSGGYRYLCDLGDQWLQPILIDKSSPLFCNEPQDGFFPASRVQIMPSEDSCRVLYQRPSGKVSTQSYSLSPVELDELMAAGEISQNLFSKPLVEMRVPLEQETAHWEFCDYKSWLSTSQGQFYDVPVESIALWAMRISSRTGMNESVVTEALQFYASQRKDT